MEFCRWLLSLAVGACFYCTAVSAPLSAQAPPDSQSLQQTNQSSQEPSTPAVTQAPSPVVPQQPADQSQPNSVASPITPVAPVGPSDGSAATDLSSTADAENLANGRIGPNYVLGPEDVVEMNVFDVPEMSHFDVQVANDGTISVPLIGSVRAAGLTQYGLRDELAEKLGEKYLNDPQVTLFIKSFASRPVSVLGSVAKPGRYYLTGRRNLMDVLALAGGLASIGAAAGKYVYIERPGGFQDLPQVDGIVQTAPDKVSIELHKLLYSQDSNLNIEIHPFDEITVSRAGIVYLVGAFNRPGGYVLDNKDTMTALEAVALAQGIGSNARTSEGRVIHRTLSGTVTSESSIDVKKLMRGKIPDVTLADNDIFFLPNSGAKGVAKGTLGNIVGIVSGIAIYRGL
jgi:polysaccharide biosynthesis/export protein